MNDAEYRLWLLDLAALRHWAESEPTPLDMLEESVLAFADALADATLPFRDAALNLASAFGSLSCEAGT